MTNRVLRLAIVVLLLVPYVGIPGCVSLDIDGARKLARLASFGSESPVELRKTPKNPLAEPLNLIGWGGPQPTSRTTQLLRRFDLLTPYELDAEKALQTLHKKQESEPSLEKLHALAELSYIQAERAKARSKVDAAKKLYASTIVCSYEYLFDPHYRQYRNVYDPEFRSSSQLYNVALEGLLRQIDEEGNLRPGFMSSIEAVGSRIEFTITVNGPWHANDFERFEFASDYEVNGLNNTYNTYGLGVPLIAVRNSDAYHSPDEEFYPKGLSFPVTAFWRILPTQAIGSEASDSFQHCAVELHDPMRKTEVRVEGRTVPLESDITTPLAFYLNDPLVSTNTVATLKLLNTEFGKEMNGLYMLEPYDPNRIPVVMVHGLWSTPVTWMEMFNDLRSLPEIRENYQFWFYMYPTGQPFWLSAEQMRKDLARASQVLDPNQQAEKLNQMVLVGHSMGGLVSRLQTVYSGDQFWSLMSERSFDDLNANEDTKEQLASVWFFEPTSQVRRVITIGTPHRGSEFANPATRWLGRSFIVLPKMLTNLTKGVVRDNPSYFDNTALLTMNTSVDSLSPNSPVLPTLLAAQSAPWVTYHNIVGMDPGRDLFNRVGITKPHPGDGIVKLASASLDFAASEVQVPAAHSHIHQHPRAILEVRRILLEHLATVQEDRTWDPSIVPVDHQQRERARDSINEQSGIRLSDHQRSEGSPQSQAEPQSPPPPSTNPTTNGYDYPSTLLPPIEVPKSDGTPAHTSTNQTLRMPPMANTIQGGANSVPPSSISTSPQQPDNSYSSASLNGIPAGLRALPGNRPLANPSHRHWQSLAN